MPQAVRGKRIGTLATDIQVRGMSHMNRRNFLKNSMAATASVSLSSAASPFVSSAGQVEGEPKVAVLLVDTDRVTTPIDERVYGQFLEHNGGIINNNIWAEMLDDRKFYYPATSHPPARASRPKLPSHDSAPLDADWL